MTMKKAVVCFLGLRGFGFLRPVSPPAPDLYFHVCGIEGPADLRSGDLVTYEVGERHGKPIAVRVRLQKAAPALEGASDERA
jgi:cold shock CspA family protein